MRVVIACGAAAAMIIPCARHVCGPVNVWLRSLSRLGSARLERDVCFVAAFLVLRMPPWVR